MQDVFAVQASLFEGIFISPAYLKVLLSVQSSLFDPAVVQFEMFLKGRYHFILKKTLNFSLMNKVQLYQVIPRDQNKHKLANFQRSPNKIIIIIIITQKSREFSRRILYKLKKFMYHSIIFSKRLATVEFFN